MRANARETFARDTIGASLLGRMRDVHAGMHQVVIINVVNGGKVWVVGGRRVVIEIFCGNEKLGFVYFSFQEGFCCVVFGTSVNGKGN